MTTNITIHSAVESVAKSLFADNFADTQLAYDADCESGIRITSDNTFEADGLPDPDQTYTNDDSKVAVYDLAACRIFLESGPNHALHVYPPKFPVQEFIEKWDWAVLSRDEWLASWGFDVTPDEADEDATDVRIWMRRYFYESTLGAPKDGYLHDDEHETMIFDTYWEAQAWIDEADDDTYYLAHGEYERPDYTIVD